MLGPFDGERARHGEDARFGTGGWHHVTGAGTCSGVGGDYVQYVAGFLGGDPSAAEHERAVECSGEDDSNYGVERVRRKFFASGDEIAGGVVDERIDRSEFFFGCGDYAFDGSVIANVGDGVTGLPALRANVIRGLLERLFATAGEKNIGAEFSEAESHRAAEAGAAAGDKDRAAFQQIWLVHRNASIVILAGSFFLRAVRTARQIRASKAKHNCKGAGGDAGVTEWQLWLQKPARVCFWLCLSARAKDDLFGWRQEFFWQRVFGRFFLPHDCDDPPARAVVVKLKAIDAACEGLFVLGIVTRFVGAEDLHDVAVALGFAGSFALDETVLIEVGAGAVRVILGRHDEDADAGLVLSGADWNEARAGSEKRIEAVPIARAGGAGDYVIGGGEDSVRRSDIGGLCGRGLS